jgi:hypothetical protein
MTHPFQRPRIPLNTEPITDEERRLALKVLNTGGRLANTIDKYAIILFLQCRLVNPVSTEPLEHLEPASLPGYTPWIHAGWLSIHTGLSNDRVLYISGSARPYILVHDNWWVCCFKRDTLVNVPPGPLTPAVPEGTPLPVTYGSLDHWPRDPLHSRLSQ